MNTSYYPRKMLGPCQSLLQVPHPQPSAQSSPPIKFSDMASIWAYGRHRKSRIIKQFSSRSVNALMLGFCTAHAKQGLHTHSRLNELQPFPVPSRIIIIFPLIPELERCERRLQNIPSSKLQLSNSLALADQVSPMDEQSQSF